MSAVTATELSCPAFPLDGVAPCQPWEAHTARLASRSLAPSVAAISPHGEIDASNAGSLSEYVRGVIEYCPQCRCPILDLSGLDFLGTEGISTLHTVRDRCAHATVRYAVVPSAAVSRLLRDLRSRGCARSRRHRRRSTSRPPRSARSPAAGGRSTIVVDAHCIAFTARGYARVGPDLRERSRQLRVDAVETGEYKGDVATGPG
jgi:anti-anti-sigma factor